MKKINLLFLVIILSGIIMSNTIGGFTTDYTGSTGLSGVSCGNSNCHQGTMGVDSSILDVRVLNSNNVDITKNANGYVLGATYDVHVRLKMDNSVKAGFQCVPLTFMSANAVGTVQNSVMNTLIQITPDAQGRPYVSHTTAGATSSTVISGGYATWKFKWTAPPINMGAVNFHVIANRTNNDNLSTGDSIKMAVYTIQQPQIATSVGAVQIEEISVYPNPTSDLLYLPQRSSAFATVRLYSIFGQLVLEEKNSVSSTLHIGHLPAGNYMLQIISPEGKKQVAQLMKR